MIDAVDLERVLKENPNVKSIYQISDSTPEKAKHTTPTLEPTMAMSEPSEAQGQELANSSESDTFPSKEKGEHHPNQLHEKANHTPIPEPETVIEQPFDADHKRLRKKRRLSYNKLLQEVLTQPADKLLCLRDEITRKICNLR